MGSRLLTMPKITSFWLLVRKLLFSRKKEILAFPMERTYSIHYADVDEEANEVIVATDAINTSIIKDETDFSVFWFDDSLSGNLPEHLKLHINRNFVEVEDYSPETHYIL